MPILSNLWIKDTLRVFQSCNLWKKTSPDSISAVCHGGWEIFLFHIWSVLKFPSSVQAVKYSIHSWTLKLHISFWLSSFTFLAKCCKGTTYAVKGVVGHWYYCIMNRKASYHWHNFRPPILLKLPFEKMKTLFFRKILVLHIFSNFSKFIKYLIFCKKNTVTVENIFLRNNIFWFPEVTSERHSAPISSDSEMFQFWFSANYYLKISEQHWKWQISELKEAISSETALILDGFRMKIFGLIFRFFNYSIQLQFLIFRPIWETKKIT